MNILATIQYYARHTPDQTAVRSGGKRLTYGELWDASGILADWLLENNPSPGEPIPVYGHKHPWMLVCFLGCVRAGCAYCPVDVSVPAERVKVILHSLTSRLVLAVEPLAIESGEKQVMDFSASGHGDFARSLLFAHEKAGFPAPGTDEKKLPSTEKSSPSNRKEESFWVTGDSTYYIIFTSGSTGAPKGVQISADCLNHFLDWSVSLAGYPAGEYPPEDVPDRSLSAGHAKPPVFLNQAPFSFDLSVMDLYTCLAAGGTLYCLEKPVQADYSALLQALEDSHTTVWVSTPSFADLCLSEHRFSEELLPDLQTFLFCGETLSNRTVKKLQQRFPKARIINTYGPTESTVAVTEVLVTPALNETESPLPVGRAKPGTLLEIRDKNGTILPEEEKGEIIILGDTVSTGYYHAPELTQNAFFQKALNDRLLKPGGSGVIRGYHTGDLGYLKNGCLYYCGRMDLQVKLHGYRIELEDIENNLRKLPGVVHAVVLPNSRNGKVSSLTAYIQPQILPADPKTGTLELKKQLADFLPDYMIPKQFVFLEQMPVTINGKADRRLLEGMR